MRDPVGLLRRGYETLGPVFRIQLAGKPAAVLIGPENSKFFFEETDRTLSMREVYRFLIPMFGDDIFFAAGPESYNNQREIILPAFSVRRMPGYIQAMAEETLAWLDGLGEAGEFDVAPTFEQLTMVIAASALLGKAFRQQMGSEFAQLYRQLAEGVEFLLPTDLPLPRFRRRDQARVRLEALVREVIAERRANPGEHQDFLQAFLEARYPDGSPPPEQVLVSMVMGMVFAGHETTAGHASWGLVQLLQHPAYLETVAAEADQVLGGPHSEAPAMSMEKIRQLERLEWALKETERMRPVASMLMRYNSHGYDLGGYHIPQGWLSIASPAISHRLPEVFSQPDDYTPERFGPGREEQRQHQYSLIGFGGGRHKCLGMNFAYTEMKVIFSLLLTRYRLELTIPDPQPDPKSTTSRPQRPCMVRYTRR
jgi:sterol 14-demethylase